MNISELSASQLRQAASIKEQIEALHQEMSGILGMAAPAPAATKPKPKISAAGIARIKAAQKIRWAKIKGATAATPATATKPAPPKKLTMSAPAKAAISKTPKVVVALKPASKPATVSAPAPKKKWKLSAAGLARIKAANQAYWAKKKKAAQKS